MPKSQLIIATRQSPLALWQAEWVKRRLEALHPELSIRLLGLTTIADRLLEIPLTEVGGKGLFVKELEEALLAKRADIAVHSMKDVPMELPAGLCLPVMCEREDPRDAFVSNHYPSVQALPPDVRVGTSSLRRQSQILALRTDLNMHALRGNVNTRLKKLDDDEFDAIILASAGLKRLNLADRITNYLSVEESLPAAGQGVLGIECREDDHTTQHFIAPLNHANSAICVTAERALCTRLGGGCQAPVAAFAEITESHRLDLRGLVASLDGKVLLRSRCTDDIKQAALLGTAVAEDLLKQGAADLLNNCAKHK